MDWRVPLVSFVNIITFLQEIEAGISTKEKEGNRVSSVLTLSPQGSEIQKETGAMIDAQKWFTIEDKDYAAGKAKKGSRGNP